MQGRHAILAGLFILGISPAPQAQTLAALEAQLARTQSQLQRVQTRLGQAQRQVGAVQQQAQTAVQAMLRLQQYPPTFWLAQRVHSGAVGSDQLLGMMAQQQATQLATLQQRYRTLFNLYGQAQAQQQALAATVQAIRQRESRSQRQQRALLAELGRDASALAISLQQALGEPLNAATLPPAAATMPTLQHPVAKPTASALSTAARMRQRPLVGRVIVGFRQGEGAEREGVVLAAAAGSRVVSPLTGKVLFAEGFRQFGGLVIVEGADGHEEVLGGLGALNVLAGQPVKAGQPLGELGPRGRLYWEVRVRGVARNPLSGLAAR
ncbi:MAG: M23 family metallopeptidase [Alphaproteobacteria bacterium]|nr:M23 family metallopeptidase [Alphaproteobacteria bacterium]